jgi:hypothetical protein
VWKFTIVPLLNPHEPKLLPYWIPCEFLQAFSLLNDANASLDLGLGEYLSTKGRIPFNQSKAILGVSPETHAH